MELQNGTDEYPEGDNVGVATRWSPRPMFEGMDADALRAVFDRLRSVPHSPSRQSKKVPWVGKPLLELGGRTDQEAKTILQLWMENGVIAECEVIDDTRNTVKPIALDEAKVVEILSSTGGFAADYE